MSISEAVKKEVVAGSAIRKMYEAGFELRAKYGDENVFDLSLGNPIMEPPPEFDQELRKILDHPAKGSHRYMLNAGYPETRAAVAAQLKKETGVNFTVKDIIMTSGAAAGLNIALKSILNPGEEVIIFAPHWPDYRTFVLNYGCIPKFVPPDERFMPKVDVLEAILGPKTKAVLFNSPNNPSGAVFSKEILIQVGELLGKKEKEYGTTIFLISDEVYRKLIYDGLTFPFIWDKHPNSIVVTSHSKDLGLAGERIGYNAIHPECRLRDDLSDAFVYCQRTLGYVSASALMQHLVRNLQNVTVDIADYEKKRNFIYNHLVQMGYAIVKPQGSFFMLPKSPIDNDIAFVEWLRDEQRVLVVAGRSFGAPGYFRISFCVTDRELEGSLKGFKAAALKYGLG